jgi:uncharacterized protein (DUF111 family)
MVLIPAGAATTTKNESQEEEIQIWERPTQSYHAHFDCFSGAAGDMMLAACLDASDQAERLTRHVTRCISLGLPELAGEFELETNRVWRGGMGSIAGLHVTVHSRYNHAPAPVPNHQLDQKDSHSHDHEHSHEHRSHDRDHDHDHEHSHKEHRETDINTVERGFDKSNTLRSRSEHDHSHKHAHVTVNDHSHSSSHSHGHSHRSDDLKGPLRNLPEIQKMLEEAPEEYIAPWVHAMASSVFTELALAEAQTHGAESIDAVHFHEVGAVDSIVDTVGTLIALYSLGVTSVSCSRLPMGEGTVWTEHGLLPVPAPATLRLMVDMPICQVSSLHFSSENLL